MGDVNSAISPVYICDSDLKSVVVDKGVLYSSLKNLRVSSSGGGCRHTCCPRLPDTSRRMYKNVAEMARAHFREASAFLNFAAASVIWSSCCSLSNDGMTTVPVRREELL